MERRTAPSSARKWCLVGQGLVDEGAEDAAAVLVGILLAPAHLVMDVAGHHGRGDDLAVRVRDAPARGRAEILEDQHRADARVTVEELAHALAVHAEEQGQVPLAHLVQPDAVQVVVDDDLVAAVAVDGPLHSEVQDGAGLLVAQHGVEVAHDAHRPGTFGGHGQDFGRSEGLVAGAEGALGHERAGIVLHGRFAVLGPQAPRRGDEHRLRRHDGIHTDLPDDFGHGHPSLFRSSRSFDPIPQPGCVHQAGNDAMSRISGMHNGC
jgi:hypothetical protein